MTNEEKHAQKQQRNTSIVAYYLAGYKLKDCASRFRLGRQRILQILQAAGVWQPYVKGDRTQFIGVNVSEETKGRVRRKAGAEGKSVSRFAAEVLDEATR